MRIAVPSRIFSRSHCYSTAAGFLDKTEYSSKMRYSGELIFDACMKFLHEADMLVQQDFYADLRLKRT